MAGLAGPARLAWVANLVVSAGVWWHRSEGQIAEGPVRDGEGDVVSSLGVEGEELRCSAAADPGEDFAACPVYVDVGLRVVVVALPDGRELAGVKFPTKTVPVPSGGAEAPYIPSSL